MGQNNAQYVVHDTGEQNAFSGRKGRMIKIAVGKNSDLSVAATLYDDQNPSPNNPKIKAQKAK